MAQIILEIVAEGGSYAIEGEQSPEGWRFRSRVSSIWSSDTASAPQWVGNVEHALDTLNPAWRKLQPLEVHPAFRGAIWAQVMKRPPQRAETLAAWHAACAQPETNSRPK